MHLRVIMDVWEVYQHEDARRRLVGSSLLCWSTDSFINTADHYWKVCLCCFNAITQPLAHRTSADLRPQLSTSSSKHISCCAVDARHATAHKQTTQSIDDLMSKLPTTVSHWPTDTHSVGSLHRISTLILEIRSRETRNMIMTYY